MKNKILLNPFFFLNWNGGIDVFLYFLNGIKNLDRKFELIIVLPKNNINTQIKKKIYPIYSLFNFFFKRKKFSFKWPLTDGVKTIENFIIKNDIRIRIIDKDYSNLASAIQEINPKLIFPIAKPFKKLKEKNIFYVFDLQHEYLKKYFSSDEIRSRKLEIKKNLNNCNSIIVNAKNTKKNLKSIYSKNLIGKKIYSIPFAPNINLNNLKFRKNIKKIYDIKKKYFIVCNQLWAHKNHKFVIKAFHNYCKKGGKNNLIFTGNTHDRRMPNYFNEILDLINKFELNDRIKILGNILKNDQLFLMKNSEALIQASLFEGGPGGGSAYEAMSLNVPIFVSNIKVNLEMGKNKNLKYFDPYKVDKLTYLMLNYKFKTKKYNMNEIKKFSKKQQKKTTIFFDRIFSNF